MRLAGRNAGLALAAGLALVVGATACEDQPPNRGAEQEGPEARVEDQQRARPGGGGGPAQEDEGALYGRDRVQGQPQGQPGPGRSNRAPKEGTPVQQPPHQPGAESGQMPGASQPRSGGGGGPATAPATRSARPGGGGGPVSPSQGGSQGQGSGAQGQGQQSRGGGAGGGGGGGVGD